MRVEMTARRKRLLGCGFALLLLLGLDLARPPMDQLSNRFLLGAIHRYQATLSPQMPKLGVRCRFQPTCSHYGEGALRKYGALVGTARTVWRIARCGPWTPAGTIDPP
jgi:putative membrane protein insertion efficiency factor